MTDRYTTGIRCSGYSTVNFMIGLKYNYVRHGYLVIYKKCWINKFYSCYMATVVGIINGRGLDIDMHHGN